MNLRIGICLAPVLLGLTGCAFTAGRPWATITPSLTAQYDTRGAAVGTDGFVTLQSGYQLKLDQAALSFDTLQLDSLAIPVGAALDAVPGQSRALSCDPDCGVGLGGASALQLGLTHVVLSGQVRGGPAALPPTPFTLDVNADPGSALQGAVDLPADKQVSPDVTLNSTATLTPSQFNAIDFAGVVEGNPAARAALLSAVETTPVVSEVTRPL